MRTGRNFALLVVALLVAWLIASRVRGPQPTAARGHAEDSPVRGSRTLSRSGGGSAVRTFAPSLMRWWRDERPPADARGTEPQGDIPNLVDLDAAYPGFYGVWHPRIAQNLAIYRGWVKCTPLIPDGLPEEGMTQIRVEAILTFQRHGATHRLEDVEMRYEDIGIEAYAQCLREDFLANAPALSLPPAVPATFRIRHGLTWMLGDGTEDPAARTRRLLEAMHQELARDDNEGDRAITQLMIELYECIDERGPAHRAACIDEL